MIEDDLCTYLKDDVTISSYVGTRIYPVRMPQNVVYPAITYQIIGSTRFLTLSGPVSLVEGRYQIDIWSNGYGETKNIAKGIRDALQGFKGLMGTTKVQGILQDINSEQDFYEDDTDLNRLTNDFIIYYEE